MVKNSISTKPQPVLWVLPTPLSESQEVHWPLASLMAVNVFVVETPKIARGWVKKFLPDKVLASIQWITEDEHKEKMGLYEELNKYLGQDMAVLSDAGMVGVADAGKWTVRWAQEQGYHIQVVAGASAITMALSASGLTGQRFMFHGYLPIDKGQRQQALEAMQQHSRMADCAEIFIETPYRNQEMFQFLLKKCRPEMMLTIACDLLNQDAWVKTLTIKQWQQQSINIDKKPCVWILGTDR